MRKLAEYPRISLRINIYSLGSQEVAEEVQNPHPPSPWMRKNCTTVDLHIITLCGIAGKAPKPLEGKTPMRVLPRVRQNNGGFGSLARPLNAPPTAAEARMDLLDFANLRIFGNATFRPQQKRVVEAVLQVSKGFPCGVWPR